MPNSATPTCTHLDELWAPGHLGELTWQIPVELVDAVLAETGSVQRRLRVLPWRVGRYFVLARCLFPRVGLPQGLGQTHRRPARPQIIVGQGVSRSAPPPGRRSNAEAV